MINLNIKKKISEIRLKTSRKLKKQNGFTLLFAVLAATLVLSVGASIISIAVRQVLLSGTGRESQYAFYAANTGIECALYWNFHAPEQGFHVFATSSDTNMEDQAGGNSAHCLGVDILDKIAHPTGDDNFGKVDEDSESAVTIFRLEFDDESGFFDESDGKPTPNYCVDVEVRKYRAEDENLQDNEGNNLERIFTTIISQGYNTCEDGPRRIQRGLDLTI